MRIARRARLTRNSLNSQRIPSFSQSEREINVTLKRLKMCFWPWQRFPNIHLTQMVHPNIVSYLLLGTACRRGRAAGGPEVATADSNMGDDADGGAAAACKPIASFGRGRIFFSFCKILGPSCPTYVAPRGEGELDSGGRRGRGGEVRVIL